MKKCLAVFAAFLAALVLTSRTQADSRLDAMSSDPRVTEDGDITWMYPNQLLNYKDRVDFRLNNSSGSFGNGTGEWGGVTKDLSEMGLGEGALSVYLNRPFAPTFGVYPIQYWLPTGATAFWKTTESFIYQAPDAPTTAGVWGTGGGAAGVSNIGAVTPNNRFDVLWASPMGGFDLGVKFDYGDNQPNSPQNSVTTTANNGLSTRNVNTAQTLGLDLGVGLKSNFFSQVNFHLGGALGSFQDAQDLSNGPTISNNGGKDDGIYTVTAGALLQHDFNPDDNLRVFADWNLSQFAAEDTIQVSQTGSYTASTATNYSASTNYALMVATLGFGGNHKFSGGKSLLTSGFLVSFWSAKQTADENDKPQGQTASANYSSEQDLTTWDLAWNTGLEARLTNWLTVRAGIEKSLVNNTDTKLTTTNPSSATQTVETTGDGSLNPTGVQFHMGLGVNVEDWTLNTVISAQGFEQTIGNVQPGNGIFFDNHSGTGVGPIVTVLQADLTHPL